jgi:hypothetical protein
MHNAENTAAPFMELPSPLELATLAARLGKTDRAGVEEALALFARATLALHECRGAYATDAGPIVLAADLSTGKGLGESVAAAKAGAYTVDEAMKELAICDRRTLHKLVRWASKDAPEEGEKIIRTYLTPRGMRKGAVLLIDGRLLEQLRTWKRDKKAEEGLHNRTIASRKRVKRKKVK